MRDNAYIAARDIGALYLPKPFPTASWIWSTYMSSNRDVGDTLGLSFSISIQPMWVFDRESLQFLAVNDAAVEQYGYTREEFLAMTILDIGPVQDVPKLLHATLHPATTGASQREHWQHLAKDGRAFWVEIRSEAVRYRGHNAEVVMAMALLDVDSSRGDLYSSATS